MDDFQAVFSAQAAEASYLMQRWLSWGSWNICSCPFSLHWVMLLCFLQLQSHYDLSRDGAVVAAQSPLSQQVAQETSPRLATVLLKSFSSCLTRFSLLQLGFVFSFRPPRRLLKLLAICGGNVTGVSSNWAYQYWDWRRMERDCR